MIYRFDDITLDPAKRELRRNDTLVELEPQVFDLLRYLIEARDRVVTRDDLLERVWQGRIVSDATLSSRIAAARAAIGDTGAEQRLIRTLPRKGLRFVAPVDLVAAQVEPILPPLPPRRVPRLPAIAVLPFANTSDDQAEDYLADGIAEEIITALSRVSGLFVIARSSSFAYRGQALDVRSIGRDLGVGYLLEGSVRRSGDRLRITGHLVDAASGATLWAERYEGSRGDVFALEDRVASAVASAIEPTIQHAEAGRSLREPPVVPDAHDLLLRANAFLADFTAASLLGAIDCLDRALAIDPASAPALATTAYARALGHFQGWVRQGAAERTTAVARAWRAVELAPSDPQVLWMAAFAIWNMAESGHERARELFRRSLELNPNCAMALMLAGWIETMCGERESGRVMVERARRLNPRDPRGWLVSGVMALDALIGGSYAEALRWAESALAENRRFAVALRVVAVAAVKLGAEDRARAAVRELLAIEPDLTVSGFLARIPVPLEPMARAYEEGLAAAGLPV